MATTAITTAGKTQLFSTGWKDYANKIKLYKEADAVNPVDTQSVTFTYNSTTKTIEPTADIVFDVTSGTQDVSYVELIYDNGVTDTVLYTKTLDTLYDFPTAGTLTIDNWSIGISSSNITNVGKEVLLTLGWAGLDIAMVENQAETFQSTEGTSFTVTSGELVCDETLIFAMDAGSSATKILIGYLGGAGSPTYYYSENFTTTYSFTNAGNLSVANFKVLLS